MVFCQYLSLSVSCSHARALYFYTESVKSAPNTAFTAVGAASWSSFMAHNVNSSNVVNMGIDCPMTASGNYYLQTNSQPSYSLGSNGIQYTPQPRTLAAILTYEILQAFCLLSRD